MKLNRLQIDRLPGIAEGFALAGLTDGINLVTAPNAFGKSSLIRALKSLLTEPKRDDPPVSLAADFTDGDDHWRVTRTGSHVEWQRNGVLGERPPLPDAGALGRYWLSMENLIAANTEDADLASELVRDLRGGFDLDAARIQLGARHGLPEDRAVRDGHSGLRQAEREASQISARQDRLPEIEAAIRDAHKAQTDCQHVETAIQLSQTVLERRSLQGAMNAFPAHMERLVGIEPDAFERLNARIETSRDDIRSKEHARLEAQDALQATGLAQSEVEEADMVIEASLDKLSRLQALRAELDRLEQESVRLETRLREVSDALGGETPPTLTRENLQLAEGFASALLRIQEEVKALEVKIERAGEAPSQQVLKQHEKGVDALRDWLDTGAPPAPSRGGHWLLIAAFMATLASPVAAAWHPYLGLACLGATLASIGAAWWWLRRASPRDNAQRQSAEKRFAATDLKAPNWDTHSVRVSLKAFDATLAGLQAQRSLAEGGEDLKIQLKTVQQSLAEKASERARLADLIGFHPAMPLTELDRFIRLAKDWDEAKAAVALNARDIEHTRTRIKTALADIARLLSPWHHETPSDIDTLAAQIAAFQQRMKTAKQAVHDLRLAEQALKQLTGQATEWDQNRATLFEKAGVDNGDVEELDRRFDLRESWAETRKKLEAAKVREVQSRQSLEGHEALLQLADGGDASPLEALLEERTTQAEALEGLLRERSEIMAEIKQAESGSRVRLALANLSESLAAQIRKRDQHLFADATDLLLDQVETAYTARHQPRVLREADELFRQVTAHEFAVRLGDNDQFEAIDLRENARRDLAALSTGTRMQLLLAVRMAWVRCQQAGTVALPVFLDEALITSDEQRFMEVAKTLQALATSTGAQIIYLSARRGEVALWQAATGEVPNTIDLDAERAGERRRHASEHVPIAAPEIPKPTQSAESYAEALGVPAIDPHRDAGEIHVFHLLRDDLDSLYRLLRTFRLGTLGQLQSWLEQTAAGTGHQDWRDRLAPRCLAARAWTSAWRQGNPAKLDAVDLEVAGAFSPDFLPRAQALLHSDEVAGDAARLVTALRGGALRRLRSSTIDKLASWLQAEGFVDDRPPLSADERFQHMLRAVPGEDEAVLRDVGVCFDWLESGTAKK